MKIGHSFRHKYCLFVNIKKKNMRLFKKKLPSFVEAVFHCVILAEMLVIKCYILVHLVIICIV